VVAKWQCGDLREYAHGDLRGGSLVSLSPSLDAHIMVHPGQQVDERAAGALNHPTCLLPSMNEDEGRVRVPIIWFPTLMASADGSVPQDDAQETLRREMCVEVVQGHASRLVFCSSRCECGLI